jgi:hypothetical protein
MHSAIFQSTEQLAVLACCRRHATAPSIVIGITERLTSQLPNGRFRHPPDQCILAQLPVISDQDRKLVTTFRSPVTTAPFGTTIAGSMFLACYFASLPHVDATRSDFGSATVSGLRRKTAVSLPQSRCSAFVRLVGNVRSVPVGGLSGWNNPSSLSLKYRSSRSQHNYYAASRPKNPY